LEDSCGHIIVRAQNRSGLLLHAVKYNARKGTKLGRCKIQEAEFDLEGVVPVPRRAAEFLEGKRIAVAGVSRDTN
jgi:hypothetical protein